MLRVLILSGEGGHNWRTSTPALQRILTDTGRFDVRLCEAPIGLNPQTLADFDVIVDDHGSSSRGGDVEKAVAGFVESGKGLVITHGALGSLTSARSPDSSSQPAEHESNKRLKELWPTPPSSLVHPPVHFLEIKISRADHPIVRGLQRGFKIADAPYRGMTLPPGADVLALAVRDNRESRDGRDVAVLIASGYGRGRVFCTALGHDAAAMQERAFITTFARGTEWAATGTVSLPADLGPPAPDPDAVRGLVIIGGHDHETSFYSIFDGYKDLARLPVAPSSTAFQKDLRDKYDVIIMYDFSRDLDETGKKNLRDFVESGKGIVVLHHALLNYQQWPWWAEEVVGGRYRLRPDGDSPSSTVKDGQHLFVTPEGSHAITTGIDPFHIVDESYKRMWFSTRIRPLLSTDNPNSDRDLAWIGPSPGFRAVAIQLGHGHTAFGHPSYRALVHNAVLWASGRLK